MDLADKLNEFGRAALKQGDYGQAAVLFQRAIDKAPNDPAYWNNLGRAYFRRRDYPRAEEAYNQAVSLKLDYAIARQGRAHLRLLQGDWLGGWSDYRWRYRHADGARPDRVADRINLKGQKVVLYRDLGLGDEIFFLRWLPELQAIAASVKYAPDPRLFALLKRSGIPVLTSEDDGAIFESVADLPFLLRSCKTPRPVTLKPSQPITDDARKLLERIGPRPWVGYTHEAGTPGVETSLHKHVPRDMLVAAIKGPWTLVNVIRTAPGEPVPPSAFIANDPDLSLSLMSLLDEYVTVSNTNVHLRAGLGLPSRVLVPEPPEFRWGLGDRSLFFPDCPLYRQRGTAWLPALNMLKEDLWQRLTLTSSRV